MPQPIGGDQVVRVDHDWQKADEGEAEQQDRGEDGYCPLHQLAVFGDTRFNSDRNKDCCNERRKCVTQNATAEKGAKDNDVSEHDGDQGEVSQKGPNEGHGSCPEENVGQEEQRCLQRFGDGGIFKFIFIPGSDPPLSAALGDGEKTGRDPDVLDDLGIGVLWGFDRQLDVDAWAVE